MWTIDTVIEPCFSGGSSLRADKCGQVWTHPSLMTALCSRGAVANFLRSFSGVPQPVGYTPRTEFGIHVHPLSDPRGASRVERAMALAAALPGVSDGAGG